MFRSWKRLVLLVLPVLFVACGAPSATRSEDPAKQSWEQVTAQAKGTTVNMFMWGGDDNINRYINEYIAPQLKSKYDITLKQTPVSDTVEAVNKVLGEKTANKATGGSVDLVWINGENYRTMRQGNLLYGPWAQQIPNAKIIPWSEPSVANDFGYPVEGYEAPWGRAQFVMVYDSARVPEPPKSFAELLAWAKEHPGRFTYPAPPDFTGSVFVRHGFYEEAGGYKELLGSFDQKTYDAKAPAAWTYFNELKPLLWRNGETFPQGIDQLDQLFANGEVDFTMSYNPAHASGLIDKGTFPKTTKTYQFDAGTIANTHYLAIPFNAANKAGAMILADLLESPAAQIEKAKPATWGDLPVVDATKLSAEDKAALDAVPRGEATLAPDALAAKSLPELQGDWLDQIEKGWQSNVLKK